jgi:citrate lyase beta subunit
MFVLLTLADLDQAALDAALAVDADAVCLDIEGYGTIDRALALIAGNASQRKRLFLKINPPGSYRGADDLQALLKAPVRPAALVLPHIRAAAELALVDAELELARIDDMTLQPIVERPAVANAPDRLLAAAARTSAVYFNGAELARQLRLRPRWDRLIEMRRRLVEAARAYRLPAIDGPHADPTLPVEVEAALALEMGFVGKIALDSVEAIRFRPPEPHNNASVA